MKNSQKGFAQPLVISIIVLTLVISGGWYFIYKNKKAEVPAFAEQTNTKTQAINTQPSITVLSPNGGETFAQGGTISGSYTTSNVPEGTPCNWYILGTFNTIPVGAEMGSTSIISGKQVFSGKIKSSTIPGNYKVNIGCHFNIGDTLLDIQDESDSYFAITKQAETSNLKTYANTQYGFSIQYPDDAQVTSKNINGGEQFSFMRIPSKRGVHIDIGTQDTFRATPTEDQCDKKDGVQVNINGVIFYSGDVGAQYSGMGAGNYATQYCTIKNGVHYKLISLIPFDILDSGYSPSNAKDAVLDQMIKSFKFTK